MSNKPKETIYYGNNCVTKYWIWNEEHNCIAYGEITSKTLKEKKDNKEKDR